MLFSSKTTCNKVSSSQRTALSYLLNSENVRDYKQGQYARLYNVPYYPVTTCLILLQHHCSVKLYVIYVFQRHLARCTNFSAGGLPSKNYGHSITIATPFTALFNQINTMCHAETETPATACSRQLLRCISACTMKYRRVTGCWRSDSWYSASPSSEAAAAAWICIASVAVYLGTDVTPLSLQCLPAIRSRGKNFKAESELLNACKSPWGEMQSLYSMAITSVRRSLKVGHAKFSDTMLLYPGFQSVMKCTYKLVYRDAWLCRTFYIKDLSVHEMPLSKCSAYICNCLTSLLEPLPWSAWLLGGAWWQKWKSL